MFLSYVHSFRAIAILFVVAGHAISIFPWPSDPLAENILSDTLENGTVMFVFVAGFLFQHLSENYRYGNYLLKKVKNVLLPYLLIASPAAIEGAVSGRIYGRYPQLDDASVIYRFFWFMIKGGAGANQALWFIPMIMIFYLAAPIFIQFIKRPQLYLLLIVLVPLSLLAHRDAYPNLDTLGLALYYFPAYLVGMWTSQYQTKVEPVLDRIWPWLLLAWFAMLGVMILFSPYHGNYQGSHLFSQEDGIFDWIFAQKLLLSFALLGLIRKFETPLAKPLRGLADTSFAIYFIHCYLLDIVAEGSDRITALLGLPMLEGSVMLWLAAFLFAAGGSYAIALAVRRLLGTRSRYVIGA
jgi:peptidoglycan/LPS O-acetylase OafA/YrhL